ncbi:MAG: ribosome recycling factor [Rhizobiales bacterium]|jgi:ribosome recycling factor|nr:ribosome recycling factor [Hyphomicrobiales bacterium]MBO6698166.1 ribosome recycling factor [Hyphomicrobiales bacterium]MBO6735580.1 ribosome recycling factor [Hyphomicrobiales bacterium]MBO6910612.1 ribosome recycling factor [Hyphomicrobiales bacterium]MBO6956725.1 ribosome recycling factor [Hyphomicrobiales bacterium]
MSEEIDLGDLERRMQGAVASLKSEFGGLRTGRASSSLVEPIMVEAYGSMMPMTQVATVSVPEPRMISINVWDKGTLIAVEKAIRQSNLGLNPVVDGTNIRLPIPELNEERRTELTKVAQKYAEQARIAIRHVRRDGLDSIKKADGLSEDDVRSKSDQVQKLTDRFVGEVDKMLASKETEIMQI